MKKILSAVLATIMAVTMFAYPVSAAKTYAYKNQWGPTVRCTLKNTRKSGTVRVQIPNWGISIDVRMRNGSRTVWSQNNAVVSKSAPRSANVHRDFYLGNNYKYYDLSFRHRHSGWSSLTVNVTNRSNCKVARV